jgi:hypothetical protein
VAAAPDSVLVVGDSKLITQANMLGFAASRPASSARPA